MPLPEGPGDLDPRSALLAEAAALESDTERQRFYFAHPDLAEPEFVGWLCDRVTRLLRVDLGEAECYLDAAEWLARELDDDWARGRSLRAAGNLVYSRRDYRRALNRYEAALERFAHAGDALEEARTRSTAVVCLSQLGEFERALDWAEKARRVYLERGEPLHLARLENNVGHILSRQDRFREALEHYRLAHEYLLEAGQPEDVAVAMRNLATCYQDLGDFPTAVETYQRATEFCDRHGLPLLALKLEFNVAYLHYLRGEYTRAIHLIERSRRSSERHGDPHHQALCDLDQSEIYLELNLVDEARQLADRAALRFQELGMRYETAKALNFRAIAASRLGEITSAVESLERARELFAAQGNRVWMGANDLARAQILYREGLFAEARHFARAALESFRETGLPTRTAACEILLARLALTDGNSRQAQRLCGAALERLQGVGMPALEFQAHLVSGQAEESAGRREAALAAYHRSHAHLERLRSHLQTDDLKIAFTEDKRAVFEALVELTVATATTPTERQAVFSIIEQAKSRSLSDLLAFRAQDLLPRAAPPARLVREIRTLRDELNFYYRQIDQEELKGEAGSSRRMQRLRAASGVREKRLLRSQRQLQSADPELSTLQASVTADLEAIRAALEPGTRLLEYFIARDVIYGCVLGDDLLKILRLGNVKRTQRLHQQLQLQLGKFLLGPEYVERSRDLILRTTLSVLGQLYDELVAPFREDLSGERLVIVPHDFLHHLPYHALFDGRRYLAERFTLSYAPSATVYQLCAARGGRFEERALVLGVPDERAPLILEEARSVAEVLPNARLLLGEEASVESLSRYGEGCRVVHIATHGIFRGDNPMFSAIQLGTARLSLFDLYNLSLNAELVVLSGCGTGLSALRGADEQVGLSRGLLYAGGRSLLVTLWDVNDESTSRFMRTFYSHLAAVEEPAEALRRAQDEHRRLYEHPYYWAPFKLIGGTGGAGSE